MVPFRSSEHGAESGTEELNSEASTSAQVGFETGFEAARSEFLDDALKNALDEICEDRESASASEGVGSGPTAPCELGQSQVPRGPKLDRSSMDQLFTSAFVNTRKRLQVEMPWEKGVAKRIFSRGLNLPKPLQGLHSSWVDSPSSDVGVEPSAVAQVSSVQKHVSGPLHERALMAITDKSFQEQRQDLLNDAVEKWFAILRLNPGASETGKLMMNNTDLETYKLEARRTIEATLGVRSKTTALSRANAILRLLRWRETELNIADCEVVSEMDVWKYFCHLQDSMSAPTKAQGALSACNYMRHM